MVSECRECKGGSSVPRNGHKFGFNSHYYSYFASFRPSSTFTYINTVTPYHRCYSYSLANSDQSSSTLSFFISLFDQSRLPHIFLGSLQLFQFLPFQLLYDQFNCAYDRFISNPCRSYSSSATKFLRRSTRIRMGFHC
jgi:hypothetical protein